MAEVLAKATLLHGTPLPWDLLASAGGAALAVDRAGSVFATPGIDAYLAEPLPAAITFDGADLNARAS